MTEVIQAYAVVEAIRRASLAAGEQIDYFTSLDQALGDGDMGITVGKLTAALLAYTEETPIEDIGKYLARAGMVGNRAASSTMGTLIATALMRAGKVAQGKAELSPTDLAAMFTAADQGMQERGKAKPGDKTIIDAIHPAAETFAVAIDSGAPLQEAGTLALAAAEEGRDSVTPQRSKVGRASWVGERTEGKLDPGCALFTLAMKSVVVG